MSLIRPLAALLAALALLLGACGDDGSDDAGDGAGDGADTSAAATGGDDGEGGADLDAGIAAVVEGHEITAASVDEQAEALLRDPAIAEQLEGEDGEEVTRALRAQITSTAILTHLATVSAEELGRPVGEADVEDARGELEAQAGGPDELTAALEEQGITEAELDLQLQGLAALRNIEAALAEEAGDDPADQEPSPETGLTPAEQRAEEFFATRVTEAEVVVHPDVGTWDPATGQVTPPGSAEG